jgi:hypothetical protein
MIPSPALEGRKLNCLNARTYAETGAYESIWRLAPGLQVAKLRHRSAKSDGGSAFESVLLSKAIRDSRGPLIGSLIFSNLQAGDEHGPNLLGQTFWVPRASLT